VILALALALVATVGGALATYTFDRDAPGYARVATGAVLGLTALAFAAFGAAFLFGLGTTSLVLAAAVTALPGLLLRRPARRATVLGDLRAGGDRLAAAVRSPSLAGAVTAIYGAAIVYGVWLVADRTFFGTPTGLFIGNVNNLGDLPYHVQITASFAYGDNIPAQNPVFAGSGFSYHYIADFLAAVFVAAGASLVEGMLIVSFVLGLALVALIHRWARDLTGNAVAARIAPLLMVFSGGFGWLGLFEQARIGERGLIDAFLTSDARYTIAYEGLLRFGNSVTALLIPQRGLLLGMGLAVIVLTLLWRHLDEASSRPAAGARWQAWVRWVIEEPRMLVAGILTGLLPIVHVHTFAVVFGTAFLLGLAFREWRDGRWRRWVVYVVAAFVVALPVVAVTARGSAANVGSFIGVELGWERGTADPFTFWVVNTGLFIPLLVVGFAWRWRPPLLSRKLLLYSLPFLAWFIVPNVLRLAPWLWDNIKVLTYWWLGGVPIVALVVARLWAQGPRVAIAGRLAALALAVTLMASGALDIARATISHTYQEWDADGIAFAELIREQTPPAAVILTAPVFDTPVYLTGRPIYMGYVGYLWANGLPYPDREPIVAAIYRGDAGALDLARDHGISYVVLGPHERREAEPNEAFLTSLPVVGAVGEYRLFQIPAR
jgi:hypothetical protein